LDCRHSLNQYQSLQVSVLHIPVNHSTTLHVQRGQVVLYPVQVSARELYGKQNGFYQRRHSEETKRLLAEKCAHPSKYKGINDRWNDEQKLKIKLNQKNRKSFHRIKNGVVIDKWNSVREICRELKYDRRTVQRVLAGKKYYDSINGYRLEYSQ